MQPALTILLPVHNVQSTLAATVAEILEVASELTDCFELVIVDDGSSDATGEVAHELPRDYPQVRVVSHGRHLGFEAAIEMGLRHARGAAALLPAHGRDLDPDSLPYLWRVFNGQSIRTGRAHGPVAPTWSRQSSPLAGRASAADLADHRTQPPAGRSARPNYLIRLRQAAAEDG